MCPQNLELSIRNLMCTDSNVSVSHLVCCHRKLTTHINNFFILRYALDNTVRDYRLFVTNPLLGMVYIVMPKVINVK